MPTRLHFAVALGSLLWLGWEPAAGAGPPWLKLRSAHFELYTTAGERTGRQAILYFEQVRGFFEKFSGMKPKDDVEIRIIVFHSEQEFRRYRPNDFASAFYQPARDRDYIVLRQMESGRDPTVVHEYVHLLVKHAGGELPVWLNEGIADLYSTLAPVGDRIQIGGLIPGRSQTLLDKPWLKLETLFAVGHDSPHYNEKDRAGIFYAQSWALTHMLNLAEEYRGKAQEFLKALGNGDDAAAAFERVYNKSIAQVTTDLGRYVRGHSVPAAFFRLQLEKTAEKPDVQPASEWESGIVLAGLLEATRKSDQARQAYLDLQERFPTRWEPPAGLAYLNWRRGAAEDPRPHFARAVQLGSTHPQLYLDYALLLAAGARPDPAAVGLLRQALELKPDFDEAHYQLGYLLLRDKSYQEALVHFSRLRQVSPDRASRLFRAAAYAHSQLGQKDAALQAAANARKTARSPEDVQAAADLWSRLNAPARVASATITPPLEPLPQSPEEVESAPKLRRPPDAEPTSLQPPRPPSTVRVRGTLQQFDCLGKIARLRLLVAGEQLALAILDPQAVVIEGAASSRVDFTCGAPKNKLVLEVEYAPGPDPQFGTAGTVRLVHFP